MLTKYSFPLTYYYFFLYYQILKNTKNYLYIRFSIETNETDICIIIVYHTYGKLQELADFVLL